VSTVYIIIKIHLFILQSLTFFKVYVINMMFDVFLQCFGVWDLDVRGVHKVCVTALV